MIVLRRTKKWYINKGLKIYTTLDVRKQEAAERVMTRSMMRSFRLNATRFD